MEIRQLKYFVVLSETRNYTRASEQLYIAQSTLSQQIMSLEEDLGIKLLQRDKRRVSLTSAGVEFLEEAKKLIIQYDNCRKVAEKYLSMDAGEIVFGTMNSWDDRFIPGFLQYFTSQHPSIQIKYVTGSFSELYEKNKNNEIDIFYAPTESEKKMEKYDYMKIDRDWLALVYPGRLYEKLYDKDTDQYIKNVLKLKGIVFQDWHRYQGCLDFIKKTYGSTNLTQRNTFAEFLFESAVEDCYSLMPVIYFSSFHNHGSYKAVYLPENQSQIDMALMAKKDNANPGVSLFMNTAREYMKLNIDFKQRSKDDVSYLL